LVNRLRACRTKGLVTVIAPAGYGKSTLLVQWDHADRRPFAWVSLDDRDNDPSILLTYVTAALERVTEMDPAIYPALASMGPSGWITAVHRIATSLWKATAPIVLVLDDVQALHGRAATDALAELAVHVPPGSLLALAGRTDPPVPLARLRAGGQVLELTAADIALGVGEAGELLRRAGVDMPDAAIASLVERTEGWPAGLYLAALSLTSGGSAASPLRPAVEGDDRLIAAYLDSEVLPLLAEENVRFAMRTAVLERMSGALCDAVLDRGGSAEVLESLARSNLFIVPLDNRGEWYRYHHLLRDMLRSRLARREPEMVPEIQKRAAEWHETTGDPEEAVAYAQAAGDKDRVARLVGALALPVYYGGRAATVRSWLSWFTIDVIERYPSLAAMGTWVFALAGEADAALRWAAAAERSTVDGPMPDGSASKRGWIAMMRVIIARGTTGQLQADADEAIEGVSRTGAWWPTALLLRAYAYLIVGETERADETLAAALAAAHCGGEFAASLVAAAERSLIALEAGDRDAADALAGEAREAVRAGHLGEYSTTTLVCAASARVAIAQGDSALARRYLTHAQRLRPMLTHATPWLSVHVRLELARARMLLADAAGARSLLTEAEGILRRRPHLGVLVGQTAELRRQAAEMIADPGGASTLTAAELRLLPLLPTHLSFRAIGERLYVSTNTVKTQAISIYRKLGVSTRSEAILCASEIGLLDQSTTLRHFASGDPRGGS
jgi:LuxR family maltose regulon positive regulatory protein